MKRKILNIITTTLVVGAMIFAIFYFRNNAHFTLNVTSSVYLNTMFVYLLIMLGLTFITILVTGLQTNFSSIKLLNVWKLDGPVKSEPWLGITKNNKDTWKKVGLVFTIIISAVTAVVIYFQVITVGTVNTLTVPIFLFILLLALLNSFVEEVIFRHTFTAVVEHTETSPYISQGLSALSFGVVHYFGVPSGIPGVLMAAFFGWILSKSIHETKGFFWAWLIHFLQDVIIMSAVFLISA